MLIDFEIHKFSDFYSKQGRTAKYPEIRNPPVLRVRFAHIPSIKGRKNVKAAEEFEIETNVLHPTRRVISRTLPINVVISDLTPDEVEKMSEEIKQMKHKTQQEHKTQQKIEKSSGRNAN